MKTFLIFLFLLSSIVLGSKNAGAYPNGPQTPVTSSRLAYASTNVTTSAWVQIVASLSKAVSSVYIFDSSGQELSIGIGALGSEVSYFTIVPGGNGFLPVSFPAGVRVSLKAISGTASTGVSDIIFFN